MRPVKCVIGVMLLWAGVSFAEILSTDFVPYSTSVNLTANGTVDWAVWGTGYLSDTSPTLNATDYKDGGSGITKTITANGLNKNSLFDGLENTPHTTVGWSWSDGTNRVSGAHVPKKEDGSGMRASLLADGELAFTFAGSNDEARTAVLVIRRDKRFTLVASQGGSEVLIDDSIGKNDYAGIARVLYTGSDDLTIYARGVGTESNLRGFAAALGSEPIYLNAGPDALVNVNDVYPLNAIVISSPNVSLQWTKISGPGNVVFSDESSPLSTVTFSQKGKYVLQLFGEIDGVSASDTIKLNVYDPADNQLMAHWDFENLPDPNALIDVANGFHGACFTIDGGNPEVTAGHITDSLVAVDMTTKSSYFVVDDPYSGDPNFSVLHSGFSIAAWVKVPNDSECYDCAIFQMPEFLMTLDHTGSRILFQGSFALKPFNALRTIKDNYWHHVVCIHDPIQGVNQIYIDGLLAAEQDAGYVGDLDLGSGEVLVGNLSNGAKQFNGSIDDIRVYNYALDAEAIENLAAEGDRVLYVNVGEDQAYRRSGTPLTLEATVLDDGKPAAAVLTWSQTSGPGTASFASPNSAITEVDFDAGGQYVLRLTADNTSGGGSEVVYDELIVTVSNPTCQDVINDGLLLAADLSGDCYVDLADLSIMANNWLQCNNPNDSNCDWPW